MRRRDLLAAAGVLVAGGRAWSLDAGTAQGEYRGDRGAFEVSHAIALAMDNAEGFGDDGPGYRILLSDRPVAPSEICGLAFPPVWGKAMRGDLKGLLINVGRDDRESLSATILTTPEPGYSLSTLSLTNTAGLWSRFESAETRLSGELKPDASDDMAFQFSAPLFTNAVEADLKGAAASASEPVKVLRARAEAMGRKNLALAATFSTPESAAALREAPPEMMQQAPLFAAELLKRLKAPERVVIRRETAAVMLEEGAWASLRKVEGVWKAAD
jgi:hypothetical protein